MKLIFLALFLVFIPKTKACLGLVFIFEIAEPLCKEHYILVNATINIVQNYFSDADGYAGRAYGSRNESWIWIPLYWRDKLDLITWFTAIDEDVDECNNNWNISFADPLQQLLQLVNSSTYGSYGLVWAGSLDVIPDADTSIPLAQQVAALNIPTFIWDFSPNVTDQQLFKILAHGRTDRILTASSITPADFINFLLKEAIPLFQQSDCGAVPTPLPFSTTPQPTTTTTMTQKPTTPTTTTTTTTTTTPSPCSLLVFAEETTDVIGSTAKLSFLRLAQQLLTTVDFKDNQRFSIALYGGMIYNAIAPQPLTTFNQTLTALINTMALNNMPNSAAAYMAPILNQLLAILKSKTYAHVSTLFIGEVPQLRDPTAAYTAAKSISVYGEDIYVIDQSTGSIPSTLFSVLTGNKPGHILNGTILTQSQEFANLTSSLINNFNSYNC